MTETFITLLPMLLDGLQYTMLIAVLGILFGFIIGSLSGFALQGKNKITKSIASVYIWIIRGTPLIVQAMYCFFVIPPLLGLDLPKEFVGVMVISLNSGAFISELVRGALQGVDPGQREAGLSLGLTHSQTLFHVIVPPAFRSMLPALFNQFIISVKDTALLSVITIPEMTQRASSYAALSFNMIDTYTVLAGFYLVLISVLIILQKQVEKTINKKMLADNKPEETPAGEIGALEVQK